MQTTWKHMPCARKHEFCEVEVRGLGSRQRSQLSDADSIEEPEPLAPAPLLAIGGEPWTARRRSSCPASIQREGRPVREHGALQRL